MDYEIEFTDDLMTVADEDGNKVAELDSKAWGMTRFTSGTAGIDYRYTGQRAEAALGLYYYRARWYDPFLGRFAQAETIGRGGGPIGWDRYAFEWDNAFKYLDPSGHKACDEIEGSGNRISGGCGGTGEDGSLGRPHSGSEDESTGRSSPPQL